MGTLQRFRRGILGLFLFVGFIHPNPKLLPTEVPRKLSYGFRECKNCGIAQKIMGKVSLIQSRKTEKRSNIDLL